MKRAFASVLAGAGLTACASGQVSTSVRHDGEREGFGRQMTIWEQAYDGVQSGYIAQDFGDFPDYSSYCFDDFSTAYSYLVYQLHVPGVEMGINGGTVRGEIWEGIPGAGGRIVMSGTGGYTNGGQDLLIDFDLQFLQAGSYLVCAYVERDFAANGQWYWLATTPVSGVEHGFWNPGGGFGMGTGYQAGSDLLHPGLRLDMSFKLTAMLPAPGGLVVLGVAGVVGVRRRR